MIDARLSNMCFVDPSNPDLPTGGSFSRLFSQTWEHLECPSGDLKDAFYTLSLPPELRRFFVMEPVRVADLKGRIDIPAALEGQEWAFPRFCAVPMGWSHAVNLCQSIVKSLVLRGPGVVPEMIVSDSRRIPPLDGGVVFIYVDNIIVLSTRPGRSEELQQGIHRVLREHRLLVHGEHFGEETISALGWDIRGVEGLISPKGSRAWRLWMALDHALCSPVSASAGVSVVSRPVTRYARERWRRLLASGCPTQMGPGS